MSKELIAEARAAQNSCLEEGWIERAELFGKLADEIERQSALLEEALVAWTKFGRLYGFTNEDAYDELKTKLEKELP